MAESDFLRNAVQVCRDYLDGAWKNIKNEDILIDNINGGQVNFLLKLSLPSHVETIAGEPKQILIKSFTDFMDRGPFGIMTENIIALLLAERNLAPKVYGIFDGGRVDEFLPSRVLNSNDLHNTKILDAVVRKLARIHSLTLPISKNPNFIYSKTQEILENGLNNLSNSEMEDLEKKSILHKLLTLNPREEFKWLMEAKSSVNSPLVFCHNDLHINNILLLESESDDVIQFIDFEFSGYNFRGYDFANFFTSFCFEFLLEPPYFQMDLNKFPTLEEQKFIFRNYLDQFQRETNQCLDIAKEETQLLEEFKIFTLILYFFWLVIFLFKPKKKKISTKNITKILDYYIIQKNIFFGL